MNANTSEKGDIRELTLDELDQVSGGKGIAETITDTAYKACCVGGAIFIGLARFVSGQ